MKPLQESYRIFALLCICPSEKPIDRWKTFFSISISIICLISILFTLIASLVFFIKYVSNDFVNAMCTSFQIVGMTVALYSFISAYIKRNDIKQIFDSFQNFYDANKLKDSTRYMIRADQQGAKIVKIFNVVFMAGIPINITMNSIGSVFYCKWKYGYIDPHHLYRAYRFILPWNQNTIPGWIADAFVAILLAEAYCLIVNSLLTLFVSICKYHGAFFKMFRRQIANFTEATKLRPLPTVRLKELIHESISFHVSAKELFYQTAETYCPFILIQLIGTTVVVACCLFVMDLAIHTLNMDIGIMLFATAISASGLYLYCSNGKYATDCYGTYDNCLYESNWIVLPIQLQKYFILMIAHAQKPLYYHGYGLLILDLGTFLKIMKTVITYYMMFKTVTENH